MITTLYIALFKNYSDFACVCPCSRPYMLTYAIDFEVKGVLGEAQLNTECQLCRSEKQVLLRGLSLSKSLHL